MTIDELEALAIHHERVAADHAEIAAAMHEPARTSFIALGAKHARWAEQLRELRASFAIFTTTQKPT